MSYGDFIPSADLASIFTAFAVARFETQRWARALLGLPAGTNDWVSHIVFATFNISSLFSFVFLVAVIWDFGWLSAITLMVLGFAAMMVRAVVRRDSPILWMLGLLGCWVLMVKLGPQVSWFGFLR